MVTGSTARLFPTARRARSSLALAAGLMLAGYGATATASDACSTRAIAASADVTVSDGTAFRTEAFFRSVDEAAIRHIDERDQVVAVEGPFGWARAGGQSQSGADFFMQFALGHQYHAFLLHFDELVSNPRVTDSVSFRGGTSRARSGDYPYGGTVHRVDDAESGRVEGFVFELPESPPIEVVLSDWRDTGGQVLPFRAVISDGERDFDYRYSRVDTAPKAPLWFFEQVAEPALDPVRAYRLHRKLLAAHCLGDAAMIADLSADEIVSANAGELRFASSTDLRERFTALFERVDYTEYHDVVPPVIEIAESADLGWIAAEVRAVGSDVDGETAFDSRWAWIMLIRKVEGRWLHAGNASNVAL